VYIAKLLEIIQLQRHDFLNHLQVISGFQQLNKPDRIQGYVKQVTAEMAEMSKTTRFKMPEVTAAVLSGFYEASKCEFKIDMTVNSSLGDCEVPGPAAGGALDIVFNCIFANMSSPATGERCLKIKFAEYEDGYSISLKSHGSPINGQETFRKSLEPANGILNEYGGQLSIIFSRNITEIILVFPRKTTESDHKRPV
jgi:hypothetical protein